MIRDQVSATIDETLPFLRSINFFTVLSRNPLLNVEVAVIDPASSNRSITLLLLLL